MSDHHPYPVHAGRMRDARHGVRSSILGRVGALLGAVLVAMLAALMVQPGTALADNSVVVSVPANGSPLQASPTEISITFAEEVGELAVITLECETEPITLDAPSRDATAKVLTVAVDVPLPKGACIIRWLVNDIDNEPNGQGAISFTVEVEPPAVVTEDTATASPATTVAPTTTTESTATAVSESTTEVVPLNSVETGRGPLWLGRLLSTLGIAVVFGSLVVIAVAWPEGVEYLITIRFIRSAWALAVVGTLLYTSAAAGAVTGGSLAGPGSWLDLLDAGWSGRAALFRMIFVVIAGWSAYRPGKVNDPVTQMAALGLPALAVVAIGIGRADGSLAILGVGIGIVHALAMAIWIGGAVLLFRVVLSGPGDEDLVHAVRGFSRISVAAIVVTILSGLIQMVRLDGGDLFNNGHGRFVVFKVVLVAAMVFIGLSSRQLANQRLARAHEMSAPMAERLRRAFGTETAIGIVTLMASSWLLALDPPNVDTGPVIDYAIVERFEVDEDDDGEADLDVTVKLTRSTAGRAGLEVAVDQPTDGLLALDVVFTAPSNPDIESITQPVPLRGPGRAVLLEAVDSLPLTVAGDWTIQVNARTATGIVQSDLRVVPILNEDGTVATVPLTVPPVVTVTIAPTTVAPAGN